MTKYYAYGKRFEEEITRSIEHLKTIYGSEIYHWKIKDAIAFGSSPQMHTVPCDHLVVCRGISYFIEDKSSTIDKNYRTKYIRPHQIVELTKMVEAGGKSFFIIGKRTEENTTESAWAIELSRIKTRLDEGVSTISWEEIAEMGTLLKKVKGRKIFTYDLSDVIK